jgi:hypothetical protein
LPTNINFPQRNKKITCNNFCEEFLLKNGVNKRDYEFERETSLGFLLFYFYKGTKYFQKLRKNNFHRQIKTPSLDKVGAFI